MDAFWAAAALIFFYFRTAAAETPSAAIGTIARPGTSLSRGERNVLIAFLLTVGLWITPTGGRFCFLVAGWRWAK